MIFNVSAEIRKMNTPSNKDQTSGFRLFLAAFQSQPTASKVFGIVFLIAFLPCAIIGFCAAWISAKLHRKLPLWILVFLGIAFVGTPLVYIEYRPFEKTSMLVSMAITFFIALLFARAVAQIFDIASIESRSTRR